MVKGPLMMMVGVQLAFVLGRNWDGDLGQRIFNSVSTARDK